MPAGGPAAPPLKIFINYRHEDMPFAAVMLYRELRERFRTASIFFDQGSLRPGKRFPHEIKSHLTGAGVFIAIIGSKWASAMTAHRQRGDQDYVIKEIELALQNRWTVIPVLVDDADLPDPLQLPPAVRALTDCQAAWFRQQNLDNDVEFLTACINEIPTESPVNGDMRTGNHEADADASADDADADADADASADDEHFQMLVDEAENLVIFLGSGANADDKERPFLPGTGRLPEDTDLAKYLAAKVKLKSEQRDLAGVAQYVRMIRGEPNVFRWVRQILGVDSEPGLVHEYLARLPRRLEELGFGRRYQMIVTPKLDLALEQAFRKAGEPFDVAIYMAPGTEHAGRFVHLPWGDAEPRPIITPNEYTDFPISADYGELTRTVIVRISGAVDDPMVGYRWKRNLMITEDHYINYLGGRAAEEVIPVQILAKLRQASCLFLGYTIADWRLRVFLHWIWPGERPSGATHWAVEPHPDMLERQFWQHSGVGLYNSRLTDYMEGFDRFLEDHLNELT
jgi:hypothetical protein